MSNFKNNRTEVIDTLISAYEYFENLSDINDNGGPNTEMSLQMGIADILHYMGVPGYTSHREAVDPSYVKGSLNFGNSTMNESKNRFTVTESERERILGQHISRGYKTPINEDQETYNYNMAIQCFLNKKGVKDDSGQPLKMDGSIGNWPKSKSAQAIANYQRNLGVYPVDGVWGPDTMDKMPGKDKEMFKECVSEHGDIIDKGLHFLGLDEQGGAIGNAARSAAIQGGLAKQGNSVPQQLIDWLKKNNVKNGQWSKDLKNPQKIVVSYLPPSTLGSSKLVPLVSIYKPSTVSTDNGKWEFNGTTVIFK